MTYAEAETLLKVPKYIYSNNSRKNVIQINQAHFSKARYVLRSEEVPDVEFLWQLHQSEKTRIKITLHIQEKAGTFCLIRVDYNGNHKNPERISQFVPTVFHKYTGALLDEPHVHYHVEGYKTAAWALPLSVVNELPVKEITEENLNDTLSTSITSFAQAANIQTNIEIQAVLS